jgi:hypothetical protein
MHVYTKRVTPFQMTNDVQNTPQRRVLPAQQLHAPLEPSAFYATGPSVSAAAGHETVKRPRSVSISSIEHTSAKKSKPKPKTPNKENKAPNTAKLKKEQITAAREAAAAATIEEDNILASSRWSSVEKTKLFEWLLGTDADDRFNKHKKNPGHTYKKVISLFIYYYVF